MPECPHCQADLSADDAAVCPRCERALDHTTEATVKLGPLGSEELTIMDSSQKPTQPDAEVAVWSESFPGFEVKGVLGQGAMGKVFLAREVSARRDIALKSTLDGEHKNECLARFMDEALITGQLQHPGIVPVYRLAKDKEDQDYYTMRPIEGKAFSEILDGLRGENPEFTERYTLKRLVRIFLQICQTVRFAHDRGVIHRDLKPGNIVVGEYGEVLVIDWGMAKVVGLKAGEIKAEDEAEKTARQARIWERFQREIETFRESGEDSSQFMTLDGTIMGTPAYMPPEQASGDVDAVDFQSDLWSLGVILYEICTLRLPFRGVVHELIARILEEPPPDLLTANPKRRVPPELAEIVLGCMEKKKSERTGSVAELCRKLDDWLEGIAPWMQAADIDFSEMPDGEAKAFRAILGQWEVGDGCLRSLGDEAIIFLDQLVTGDVRVEVEARVLAGQEGEISPILSAPAPNSLNTPYDGYCLQLGADSNMKSKLAKNGADLLLTDGTYTPGKWHSIVAERVGNTLHLLRDGEEVFQYRDWIPLSGERVGLYAWGAGLEVRRFRVLSGGVAKTVSCLEIPHTLYNLGQTENAKRHYLRIADSHPGNEEGLEALFFAGECCLELLRQRAAGVDRSESDAASVVTEAWHYFEQVEQSFLGPMGHLGQSLVVELLEKDSSLPLPPPLSGKDRARLYEIEVEILANAYTEHVGFDTLDVVGERLWERAHEFSGGESYHADALMLFAETAARYHPAGLGSYNNLSILSYFVDKCRQRNLLTTAMRIHATQRKLCGHAQNLISESFSLEGRFGDARDASEKMIVEYAGHRWLCAQAQNLIGESFCLEGRFNDARLASEKMLAEYPDQRWVCGYAQGLIGESLCLEGRFEEARLAYAKLIAEYPDYRETCAWAQNYTGSSFFMEGRFADAQKAWEKTIGEYSEQRAHCAAAQVSLDLILLKEDQEKGILALAEESNKSENYLCLQAARLCRAAVSDTSLRPELEQIGTAVPIERVSIRHRPNLYNITAQALLAAGQAERAKDWLEAITRIYPFEKVHAEVLLRQIEKGVF